MREPDFRALRTRLLRGGIAPRHVRRTVRELKDHYHDLVDEATEQGMARDEARRVALDRLGNPDDVASGLLACRELRGWAWRYPMLAAVFYPLACLIALPVVPIRAGVERAPVLAKWGASLVFAGAITASMMLVLQLSILFG